ALVPIWRVVYTALVDAVLVKNRQLVNPGVTQAVKNVCRLVPPAARTPDASYPPSPRCHLISELEGRRLKESGALLRRSHDRSRRARLRTLRLRAARERSRC